MSKYGNKWTEYRGEKYQSQAEANYAQTLDLLKSSKDPFHKVSSWERQVSYPIVINGYKVCTYVADFRVIYSNGRVEVVDVKGYKTPMYRLKKKLLLAALGIEIIEV